MPEGDTLHAHARRLQTALAGQTLVRAYAARVPLSRFEGRSVQGARALGKHLLIELDTGHVLRTHLRMHGRIHLRERPPEDHADGPHVRWLLGTATHTAVCLDAPSVELIAPGDLGRHPLLSRLGPDLLGPELDAAEILHRLRQEPQRPIGSALMDQRILAGIGNVYKSEVLFITQTSPFVPVADLDDARLHRLVHTARDLMRRNLPGGAAAFPGGRGRRTTPCGRIAARYWVYERRGEPCLRCGTTIRVQHQDPLARSTYYCPECQPLPVEGEPCTP